MEFDTAVARVLDDDDVVVFTVNERDAKTNRKIRSVECTAHYPGDGSVMMLMTDMGGRRTGLATQIAGLVDFLTDVLDDESEKYVIGRLMDSKDAFGPEDVRDIVLYLMEEWSGRPTKQPSDFAPSRKTGGQSSTRRTSRSTSSRSPQTVS